MRLIDGQIQRIEPVYTYSREYGRNVLTDVRIFFLNTFYLMSALV